MKKVAATTKSSKPAPGSATVESPLNSLPLPASHGPTEEVPYIVTPSERVRPLHKSLFTSRAINRHFYE